MLLIKVILLALSYHLSSAYKILVVFPLPGKSHATLGEGFVRHLLDAGHEVTYVTPIRIKNFHSRLRQVEIMFDHFMQLDQLFDISKIMKDKNNYESFIHQMNFIADLAYNTIMQPHFQALIHDTGEHFDVVIAEWLLNELYSGLSTVFNCPLIWSSSLEPHSLVLELIDDVLNPAYNPNYLSNEASPLDFSNRVKELWTITTVKFHKWWMYNAEDQYFRNAFATSVEKRGRKLPPYHEVRYNASLVLGNSNVVTGPSIRLPQNYIAIGGYHLQEHVNPLPPNIKTILDDAQNGLIYFSMGSMAKGSSIPNEMKESLLNTFRKLNQTILWKYEEEIDDLPDNVHIISWAPQIEVLAHPNCKLFITHGGLLSIVEAIHFRVPIIGIPLFGDQYLNVNRAVEKGFCKRLNLDREIGFNIEVAIQDILHNDTYYEKIEEYSLIYRDQITPPGKLLNHWVSHVVRTKGAQHLRSPALMIPWYQKLYVDLAFAIIIAMYIAWKVLLLALNKIELRERILYRFKEKIF